MRKLNVFNWRDLLHVDTPPCVSIFVNAKAEKGQSWTDRLFNMMTPAEDLLRKNYSAREVSSLRLTERIKRFYSKKDLYPANSYGLFLSPEISAYAVFNRPFPEFVVAANSFHIKPFIYNHWQWPLFGVFSTADGHDIFLVEDKEIVPLGFFKDAVDFFNQYKLPPHSTFVFAGSYSRIFISSRRFKPFRKTIHRVIDLGPVDHYSFYEQLPLISKSNRRIEEQKFLSSLHNCRAETPFQVSDDLMKNDGHGYFASHILSPLWGEVKNHRSFLEMYEEQKDGKDDCVVDELYEIALKKGLKTLYIDSEKWKHPSPFLLQTQKLKGRSIA